MTQRHRNAILLALLLPILPASAQTPDTTLDNAQKLLRRTMLMARDGSISQSPDAGQVITALRSTKDTLLLPLFEKLAATKSNDNQIVGMVSAAILMKDPKRIDLPLIFACKDEALAGSAIASLIDTETLSNEQLMKILNESPDAVHKAMAAGELNRKKALPDHAPLLAMLKDSKNMVRYYAAVTLLDSKEPAEVSAAVAALLDLNKAHDLHEAPIQALMLVRIQKETLTAGIPWAVKIASDEANDDGLRLTAVAAALSLKAPEGPKILADMIENTHDVVIQQVKLGLISIEYASQLKPAMLTPLIESHSSLAKSIATLARKGAEGGDNLPGLLTLLKEGHPIVLDWALAYSDRAEAARQLALRSVIVSQATIVDGVRGPDYDRAVFAAQKILDEPGTIAAEGRQAIGNFLKSDNRTVVEAVLAGIFRSHANNQSELVLPIWSGLTGTTSTEVAANYAALILAREGRTEPNTWLPGMVGGGTVEGQGLCALAGWYYAKLHNQTDALLKVGLSD